MQGIVFNKISGSNIKSVQRIVVTGSATTQNITISTIDITKSICFATTWSASTGGFSAVNSIGVRLTSSTNLEVNITTANANANCNIIIVEFIGNVTVQRGTTANGVAATISTVDVTKSFSTVSMKGTSSTSGTGPRPYSYLATSTNVTFAGYVDYAGTTYWEVITFS